MQMLTMTTTADTNGVRATARGITLSVGSKSNPNDFNPLELGLVYLGGCMVLTVQHAAQKKKLDVQEITAVVSMEYIEKPIDPNAPIDPEGKVEEIPSFLIQLSVRGNIDDKQLQRLLHFAHLCEAYEQFTHTGKKVTIELQRAT